MDSEKSNLIYAIDILNKLSFLKLDKEADEFFETFELETEELNELE